MNVALEVTAACRTHPGGVGRYTLSLARALAPRLAVEGGRLELLTRVSRWSARAHRPALPGVRSRWLADPIWPPLTGVDVMHGADERVVAWTRVPRVATLHDVFSLVTEEYAAPRFRTRKQRQYRSLARRCARILAVSEATKRDFLAHHDFPAERIDVVHHGVDDRFRPPGDDAVAALCDRHGLERPYVLFVGELSTRKNLSRLVQAYARSALSDDHMLVLVGKRAYGFEGIERAIQGLGFGDRVRLPGFVDDGELPALYGGAAVFAFATLYEGFGLPILEAMACGTPVVTADAGAAPEVAGGHAALSDPRDVDSIAGALRRALAMEPGAREAARAHARGFTWERTAEATLAVYRRAHEMR